MTPNVLKYNVAVHVVFMRCLVSDLCDVTNLHTVCTIEARGVTLLPDSVSSWVQWLHLAVL